MFFLFAIKDSELCAQSTFKGNEECEFFSEIWPCRNMRMNSRFSSFEVSCPKIFQNEDNQNTLKLFKKKDGYHSRLLFFK